MNFLVKSQYDSQPHLMIYYFSNKISFIFFKVGSRGPCPLGQLVVFEKYSGKSYRGECGCSPGYNQNYWPETGQCFEWYTQGPCKDSFLFQYNRDSGEQDTLITYLSSFRQSHVYLCNYVMQTRILKEFQKNFNFYV